jgi:hyaluronoglucosaminidase
VKHYVFVYLSACLRVPPENCLAVKKYIDCPLGYNDIKVTSAAKLCSQDLYKKNGKCVRKSFDSGAYLRPRFFYIGRNPGPQLPRERPS